MLWNKGLQPDLATKSAKAALPTAGLPKHTHCTVGCESVGSCFSSLKVLRAATAPPKECPAIKSSNWIHAFGVCGHESILPCKVQVNQRNNCI